MLEQIYSCVSTIESLRNGPLGSYPDELAKYYVDLGYSTRHMKPRFGPLSQFNKSLIDSNKSLQNLNRQLIEEFIALQLETKKSFVSSGANLLFKQFEKFLVRDEVIHPANKKSEPGSAGIKILLSDYNFYLSREKGLVASSIKRSGDLARDFLVYSDFLTIPRLKKIGVEAIHLYIVERGKIYSTKHVQVIATCLRCFLRYLLRKGIIQVDLAAAIPALSSYRAAHLPEYLETDQLTTLLKSCDRQSATGVRNYAVLLLLARIGLRASEVIKLTLQEINWRAGEFSIRGKGCKRSVMPLPNDVGEALSDYIVNYRPKTKTPRVFLNTRAPFQQFSNPSTVSSIVRRQLASAGIETTSKGAHLLRYTVATHCLKNGGSLYEACELLRHFSIDTTAIYAKLDYEQLSQLAMPWPTLREVNHV